MVTLSWSVSYPALYPEVWSNKKNKAAAIVSSRGFMPEILARIKGFSYKQSCHSLYLSLLHNSNITASHSIWLINTCVIFDQNNLAPTVGPWCSKSSKDHVYTTNPLFILHFFHSNQKPNTSSEWNPWLEENAWHSQEKHPFVTSQGSLWSSGL